MVLVVRYLLDVGGRSRFLRLSLVQTLLVLFSFVPGVAAVPDPPQFDIKVAVDPIEGPLKDREMYDVPVIIEIRCTKYSLAISTGLMHFPINVTIDTGDEEPIEASFPTNITAKFPEQWCLDGTPLRRSPNLIFNVPFRYPALKPIEFTIAVESLEGEGIGRDWWNTSVEHRLEYLDLTPLGPLANNVLHLAEEQIHISIGGNAAISGMILKDPATHSGLHFEPVAFGPVHEWPRVVDIPVELNESVADRGLYPLVMEVEMWLSEHPDHRLPTETLRSHVKVVILDSHPLPLPSAALFVMVLLFLVGHRRKRT